MGYTRFMDMHSGGGNKTGYDKIYIESDSADEGIDTFYKVFGRDPYNVTCDCCGEDFSVSFEEGGIAEVTAYDRAAETYVEAPRAYYGGRGFYTHKTVAEYFHNNPNVLRLDKGSIDADEAQRKRLLFG